MALKDNIVACYEMNETSGTTANDASAGGNNGTINGAVSINQTGKLDKAYSFGGNTNNFVSLPSGAKITGSTNRTYTAWIKPTTASGSRDIFSEGTGTAFGTSIFWRVGDGGTTVQVLGYGTNETPKVTITANEWNFVFFQTNNGNYRVGKIVNGTITEESVSIGGTLAVASGNAYIGRASYIALFPYDGLIDQFCVWNTVVSDSDLQAIENSGNGLAYSSWDASGPQGDVSETISLSEDTLISVSFQIINSDTVSLLENGSNEISLAIFVYEGVSLLEEVSPFVPSLIIQTQDSLIIQESISSFFSILFASVFDSVVLVEEKDLQSLYVLEVSDQIETLEMVAVTTEQNIDIFDVMAIKDDWICSFGAYGGAFYVYSCEELGAFEGFSTDLFIDPTKTYPIHRGRGSFLKTKMETGGSL
jgi:hypothetical protein